ncbi:MBL fold metallo-hydrolase [Roseisolibacter sp. H3M3-2]|uniref:MBL fold metallo-hydrolase n=1 Tax=Roseisolibacter sp. H3M3-2 TaxID=3031323 RepID=UPI0023DBAF87|nr:MBL fold metallo-hydrolase [Roseisolibacter sp. H3M3-2]MDF1506149.1 MBL fold metallo-hydrolase [Roseisolibacter sp. H3M3-2]
MSLTLRFWRVRGSVAAPGAATARYGGNTSCVEVAHAGGALVLDAGTGLRPFGEARRAAGELAGPIDVLVTHAHADHLLGLPFLGTLDVAGAAVTVHAAPHVLEAVRAASHSLASPPLFPVPLAQRAAAPTFVALPAEGATLSGLRVRAVPALHPGGAAGFRVEDPATGRAAVYLPDNELAAFEGECGGRRELLEAIAGAEVLVHDATYLPAELPHHRGWGHSTYAEAVRLAADAGVPRLVLFHHHPERDDAALDRVAAVAQGVARAARGAPEVTVAVEGTALTV